MLPKLFKIIGNALPRSFGGCGHRQENWSET